MAAMVKRLSQGFVVPLLRVRFPLAAPQKPSVWRLMFASEKRSLTVEGLRLGHVFLPASHDSSKLRVFELPNVCLFIKSSIETNVCERLVFASEKRSLTVEGLRLGHVFLPASHDSSKLRVFELPFL